jgi:hypothetical protein
LQSVERAAEGRRRIQTVDLMREKVVVAVCGRSRARS